jgi:hypothetical protein
LAATCREAIAAGNAELMKLRGIIAPARDGLAGF